MAIQAVEMDSYIRFAGKRWTVEELAIEYGISDPTIALATIQILVNKGEARVEENLTKEQKIFQSVAAQENWVANAKQHDLYEEAVLDHRANEKREGRATYPSIEVDYPNLLKAQEQQAYFIKNLRLNPAQIEISIRVNLVVMILKDITDAEYNFVNRTYKADKMIGTTLGFMEGGVNKVTGGIDYASTRIAAPIVQIGARAGVSVFKTIATTLAKVTSSTITAASQGAKTAAHEIRHDADILRAGREIIEAKDGIKRSFNKGGSTAGGIRISG